MGDGLSADIPVVPWRPDSGLRVLVLLVCYPGSHTFSETLFKGVLSDLEKACGVLHALGDTQTEHLLARYCLDACKIMNYLRGWIALPFSI